MQRIVFEIDTIEVIGKVVTLQSLFLLFLSATRLPVEESALRCGFIGEFVEDGLEFRTF